MIYFKLKELLVKKGIADRPVRKLAEDIGIDHVSLWKMLNGKDYNPSLLMLDKICSFLKCQPGDILFYTRK